MVQGNGPGDKSQEQGERCAVLVGPYKSGKTTLLESLLFSAGARGRRGSVAEGNTLGDRSPEAVAHEMTVEPNVAHCSFLEEPWSLIDCPGSVELRQEGISCLMAADVAVIVAEPDPDRAPSLAPLFKLLDRYQIPHLLFINKMDKTNWRVKDILEGLQAVSSRPLLLRQVPIRQGDTVTGFVDLVSERAYRYAEGKPSKLIEMPDAVREREGEARQEMLESLADFDDALLEQLLEDKVPASDDVYGLATEALQQDQVVPVFLGAAEHMNGVGRLWKALRHEGPYASQTAARLRVPFGEGFAATVVKTFHQAHLGKLSLARLWRGSISSSEGLAGERLAGLHRLMGSETKKLEAAGAGALVGLQRLDALQTGDFLTAEGRSARGDMLWPEPLTPVFARALAPKRRQDEVKLMASLAKLIEDDPSLAIERNRDTHQLLLWGQGEIHLKLAVEQLKSRYNVDVETGPPKTAYKETIRQSTEQHTRFKRQSGGHGQFGDVKIEIKPLPRGAGFVFDDKVVGGAIPKGYIPSVESGVKEYLERGPLGFPVVDVEVTLVDGQHHAVDSSDQAFKTAGRMAMAEGLPQCRPVLLEPIYSVTLSMPNEATAKVHGLINSRRGQILGFEDKADWDGWDEVTCHLPQAELHDLVLELRSLTHGVGSLTFAFDHLQEITGKLADKAISAAAE
ncbi:MAG: elongation factor G [Kiloniellales bacterium]